MDTTKAVALMRSKIENNLLEDSCQIFPRTSSATISASGKPVTQNPTARTWRSTTTIPCRIDAARAFRPDKLPNQTGDVDEQYIILPFDAPVQPSDLIVTATNRYEVRKITPALHFDGVIEVLAMEFTANVDNPL